LKQFAFDAASRRDGVFFFLASRCEGDHANQKDHE
jgi:hypothetical protein